MEWKTGKHLQCLIWTGWQVIQLRLQRAHYKNCLWNRQSRHLGSIRLWCIRESKYNENRQWKWGKTTMVAAATHSWTKTSTPSHCWGLPSSRSQKVWMFHHGVDGDGGTVHRVSRPSKIGLCWQECWQHHRVLGVRIRLALYGSCGLQLSPLPPFINSHSHGLWI